MGHRQGAGRTYASGLGYDITLRAPIQQIENSFGGVLADLQGGEWASPA